MRVDVLNQLNIILRGGEISLVNKSAIARMMNCDPRTVDKYIQGYTPRKKKKRKLNSKLDDFKSIIISKLEIGCTGMSIFKFIKSKGYSGSYSLVEMFVRQHKEQQLKKATIRFETSPGQQAQVDWKENLTIVSKYGEIFNINIFLMVLGYSRAKFVKVTNDKTQKTLFNCMNEAFEFFGRYS